MAGEFMTVGDKGWLISGETVGEGEESAERFREMGMAAKDFLSLF